MFTALRSRYRRSRIAPYILYSAPYQALLRYKNPQGAQALAEAAAFAREHVGGQTLIFDVGANVGSMAACFRPLCERLICFEPDPMAALHLRRRFRHDAGVQVEQIGLADREGEAEMIQQEEFSAYNSLSDKHAGTVAASQNRTGPKRVPVKISTLDRMIEKYGRPGFIKIDVEGYEWQVLSGLTSPIDLISFEANLPTFAAETRRILDRFADCRFNFRSGNQMVLPAPVRLAEAREIVDRPIPATYDIFIYRPGSR